MMADDQRVYTDEEFALILRTAAEFAGRHDGASASSHGLTLSEMKSAAAQAGLDPALIERAARQLGTRSSTTRFEQLIGGPLQHLHETRVAVTLDEHTAARLLSAARINTDYHSTDPGHSSALGMTWRAGGAGDVLSVTARPEGTDTVISVAVDRRGTFVLTALVSSFALFCAVLFSVFALYPEAPAYGVGGLIVSIGGILGVARSIWASTTNAVRARASAIMDVLESTVTDTTSR